MTDEQEQYRKMTATPIPKLITSLSAPAVLSMLTTSIYNMTDTYFVSKLGTSAAGAVGIVFALMSIIQSFGFTLGMGSSSYISRFLGKQDEKSASVYASSATAAALVFGTLLLIFGLSFINPLIRFLGSTETILPFARDYARYILIASPLMCCIFVLNSVLRAQGKATLSMIGIMSGGLLNIALDPLLIVTFDMGISGAAIATLVSQCVSFIILVSFFLSGRSIIKISPALISRKANIYFNIVRNGFPTLCRQGMASVASVMLAVQARTYGDAAIAAMTIVTKLYMIVRSVVIGIGQGFQPVAGYNYGAGKYSRIKKGFWFTVFVGTAVCTAAAVFLFLNAEGAVRIFRRDDPDVIEIGRRTLVYFCAALPLLAYSTYVNQLLQCLGRSSSATFLAACRQGLFFVPLILILPSVLGITGIELTQAIADIITFCVTIPFQIVYFKSTKGIGRADKKIMAEPILDNE